MSHEQKEIKRIKEDLEDLEQYIQEFITFLPLAVCNVNVLGKVIGINRSFERLSGFDSPETVGQPIYKFFVEKQKIERMYRTIRTIEAIENSELTLISKQNQHIPVSVSMGARKDRYGNFLGFFLSIWNIAELKKLQEKLEETVKERTKELQEKLKQLEKFQKLTIGRELKMVELKKLIKELEERLTEKK